MPSDRSTDPTLPEDLLVTRALRELDAALPPGTPKMRLQVVGGYALLVRGVRTDPNDATDIDYVGTPLPASLVSTVDAIGLKHGLGRGWVNNDLMLSGLESVEDLEASTGPLNFEPYDSGLSHFEIEVADAPSLLRMKLTAVDTSFAASIDAGDPSQMTRAKDFPDIARLAQAIGLDAARLRSLVDEMSEDGLLIETEATRDAVILALQGLDQETILARVFEQGRSEDDWPDDDDDDGDWPDDGGDDDGWSDDDGWFDDGGRADHPAPSRRTSTPLGSPRPSVSGPQPRDNLGRFGRKWQRAADYDLPPHPE